MIRNRRFWLVWLIICLILVPMFVIQHPGVDVVEQNASGFEFLNWFLSGSFNKAELHGFLFLAMELILFLQILPEVNEQRLVRMTRKKHWMKLWTAMGFSAFVFCVTFCLIQFFMTFLYLDPATMMQSGFGMITFLFFLRLFCVYMIENGVFSLMYAVLLRKEIATAACVVFFMVIFYWVYEKIGWQRYQDSIVQAFNLSKDLNVYGEFYSESGLDLLQYLLATVKHLIWIALLYIGSLTIFEKRDILNDGKK